MNPKVNGGLEMKFQKELAKGNTKKTIHRLKIIINYV